MSSRPQWVLIDHQQIQIVMDGLVEVLSQPGISMGNCLAPCCSSCGLPACPKWPVGLADAEVSLPLAIGCVWKTTSEKLDARSRLMLMERSQALYVARSTGTAGSSSLPTRRLFCRPVLC